MEKDRYLDMVGSIVPAGYVNPQWGYVTKVDGSTIYVRKWSARSQKWTKSATGYARDALFKLTPRCPKPLRPQE
jgi:hypothetical protein